MGVTPPTTSFPSLSMENVTPAAFSSTWETSMSEWGTQIQGAVEGISQALAVGLGLEKTTFTDAATYGSHLLAPTSTDLSKYGRVGESEPSYFCACCPSLISAYHSFRRIPHRSQRSHHPRTLAVPGKSGLQLPRLRIELTRQCSLAGSPHLGSQYGQAHCGKASSRTSSCSGWQAD